MRLKTKIDKLRSIMIDLEEIVCDLEMRPSDDRGLEFRAELDNMMTARIAVRRAINQLTEG